MTGIKPMIIYADENVSESAGSIAGSTRFTENCEDLRNQGYVPYGCVVLNEVNGSARIVRHYFTLRV